MLRRLLLFVVVLALAAGVAAWWMYRSVQAPYRGFTGAEVFVELPSGTGVSGIAARLASAGVVENALVFRVAARLSGSERRLRAGEYRFTDAASPMDIVGRLTRGDVFVHPVTFPEGRTIGEMAVLFEKSGLGSRGDFERAASDGSAIGEIDPGAENLEGYLFPDTYALPRQAGAEGAVAAMVARFKLAFDADLRAAALADRWTARDIVTLASLIEKETAAPEERPIVSAVYRNRLKIGMPLQCDPTVIYALMKARRWNGNLTRADLGLNSPYNTYRFAGLPPGPIASPGKASLEAAVRPADVPYLYFVSRNDGTHVFASTLAEHNRNVARWQVEFFRRKR
jgi:UPF0755 protein